MLRQRRFLLVETVAAVALIVAPFVLPYLGFAPTTIDRILIMGLVGIGFDLLFGYAGLLSFGQSAFFGSGGMVAAWLLTQTSFGNTIAAVFLGTIVAGIIGYLVGLVALRRTGIYFAMITVAIAEVFFFVEFNPLSHFTGGENGLPGVPPPNLSLGFTTLTFDGSLSMYAFFAFWYFVALVLALRIVRSPVGLVLRAIRENPLRAQALGHNILRYKLLVFVIAAMYAGFGGGLLGLMQGFMPPDAFMFATSGEIVIMTAIGGASTLVGPLLGATVWLYLSDFFQTVLKLGGTWKLVLGLVFVLLVIFLRHGLVGGIKDLYELFARRKRPASAAGEPLAASGGDSTAARAAAGPVLAAGRASPRHGATEAAPLRAQRTAFEGPILQATGLSKHYGGVVANSDIDFSVNAGELRGIIGPNGAGKTTFFKMLTCEVPPTSGKIVFEGRNITGMNVTEVCQLGLTKSYQVNQLFDGLTVGENVTIAALAALRGTFRLDLLRSPQSIPGLRELVDHTLELVDLTGRRNTPVSELAYGEKRRLEVGLALASSPSLLLLDEPLAGMSPSERVETVKLLKSIAEGRTLIIIDHDMDALFNLAERVTVLQEGRVLVEGTPDEIKSNAQVQEAYLGGVHEELAQ
ncbi:MAG TPA: branched-chain amino acid ABC transporter ATP-binding protein/permease [Casimicrobiaceae bacterium]|nr:branched-chain amino acid ABC transporter ATP-binding protein/permease [Casimicrobiaceae bacterium]